MTTICLSIPFALLCIVAVAGRARGADAPLLVAVEAAPGVDVGAADVRQIIATELGASVVGAREATAATVADVLLVTVDLHEIRMSLRAGTTRVVSRTIAAPSDRPGRLRSIAWLAGNLVRDQVGPIVASGAPPPSVAQTPPPPQTSAVADTHPPTQPPAMPVSTPPPSGYTGPAAVVAARPSAPNEVRHTRWSITASGGPAAMSDRTLGFIRDTAYLIDVQHQSSPGSALLGVGFETGPGSDWTQHYFGAAAFIGSGWQRRWLFLEANLGLGVELFGKRIKTVTVTNNSSQGGPATETTESVEPVPELFGRVAGTAGVRVSRDLDLVARLAAHLSTHWQSGSFLSSTVGVRLRLP